MALHMTVALFSPVILAADMRDPTQPPIQFLPAKEGGGPEPTYGLTALFIRPNYQAAIINDEILYVGNHLGEYTITSISSNGVELQGSQNNREFLQLVPPVRQELNHYGQ